MPAMRQDVPGAQPPGPPGWDAEPGTARMDGGLGYRTITGEAAARTELLDIIAERVRVAADRLKLSREDLRRIFEPHSVFEAEVAARANGRDWRFILVETHHLIQGKVGKGALKIVFPEEMLGKSPQMVPAQHGAIEVLPPEGQARWARAEDAEEVVKSVMREFMTGESLSMSLKCQATGAPFAGSEGLVLCAARELDAATGRYFLRPALHGGEDRAAQDRELIHAMMNATSEVLTRAGRIAYDTIVHAAETSSTLTARLGLDLPSNVVEGHLRALFRQHPDIIVGDEDMTSRLREILGRGDYAPTACALARAAARMQIEHSILVQGSREKLRALLSDLPPRGCPSSSQYRQITGIFFGTGEIQQNEDQLYQHRERILKPLAVALSAPVLDECGDPAVLELYLKTLLDNLHVIMEEALASRLGLGQALTPDWMDRAAPLSAGALDRLRALMPAAHASGETVKASFWQAASILAESRAAIAPGVADPFAAAKAEVLERSIRAIASAGDLVPSVDRIVFFTLPYATECVTPKLGVVTRKPIEVCGSALRPEAMAVGAIMAIELLLARLGRKEELVQGMTVAVEGLGNAGKNAAQWLSRKGALIVCVSDSSGALFKPTGFSPAELSAIIAHKDRGRRLDSIESPEVPSASFDSNPESLKKVRADILVLAAIPGSVHKDNAPHLQAGIVCELSGAAVTGAAKQILHRRRIHVIPDNLASSGGLLVSLSEMLQNSAGQNWDRALEEFNLHGQLSRSFDRIAALSAELDVDLPTASDVLALSRMHDLAIYRERLQACSRGLEEHIRSIRDHEQTAILSDNDEDGVASAAILQVLIEHLNPAAAAGAVHLNESLRSSAVVDLVAQMEKSDMPIRHVFVLDRAFPIREPGQAHIRELARACRVTLVNNHDLPAALAERQRRPETAGAPEAVRVPADLGILFISPQTLESVIPSREFLTALVLREIAHQLVTDEQVLARIDWQAAVGSFLELPEEKPSQWLLFFSRFNPDKILEASRAVRMVTRAGGFRGAVEAMAGVTRPDQLHTNEAWERFMAEYNNLNERIQVLVDKIVLENRGRPFTAHFFAPDELASPTPLAGDRKQNLDFYHWISELLTRHGDLAERPIIVGQVVRDSRGREALGVRIRSPRGIDLMEAGLPADFSSGGLPNTAIARMELHPEINPEKQFHSLVDQIWSRTTSPLYIGAAQAAASRHEEAASSIRSPRPGRGGGRFP